MELYAVITHSAEWMNLGHVHDFFRHTAETHLVECAKLVLERTPAEERHMYHHDAYVFSVFKTNVEQYVIITDAMYPVRAIFMLVRYLRHGNEPQHIAPVFRDPMSTECVARLQYDVDEAFVVIHQDLNPVPEREEMIRQMIKHSSRSVEDLRIFKAPKKAFMGCKTQ